MSRMRELVDELNRLAYQYYVLDNPTVSDKEYDALYDELVALERESGKMLADSPTRRVGGDVIDGFSTHKHLARLYSLDKAQSFDELDTFFERIKKQFGNVEYTVEYKFDGLTISITYEDGAFQCAATRGNGEMGEDVTAQVLTIKSFPLTLAGGRQTLEIQGEGIMRKSVLEEYNRTAKEPLKNPRNAVAGAIRNLDPKLTASRNLDIMFYNVNHDTANLLTSQSEAVEFLRANRFKVSDFFLITSDTEEIKRAITEIGERRNALDFLIDGVVIKVNRYPIREELGFTEKFPKWAIAYKFEAEEVTTVLREVKWNVGRTGKLTPLGLLEPVELAGVTVQRATLNNMGDIERKHVKVGSRVLVRRSNDVIPEILGVTEEHASDIAIVKPEFCPSCGTKLYEEGANIFCPNFDSCKPQIVARITHYASKDAMDIDGFSEKTVLQLNDVLRLTGIHELYELTREQLLSLNKFKEKKTDKLLGAIEASKKTDLASFVYALGILNVGKKTAKQLAEKFGTLDALMSASFDELVAIDDVGEVVANCITRFFTSENNMDAIAKLIKLGVEISYDNKPISQGAFSGEKVVLTGTLSAFSRSKAAKLVEESGGEIMSSVTNDTTLVVAGESAGSKLGKAKAKGIKIIDEQQFLDMLGQNT